MDNSILVENIIRFCKAKGIAPTSACRESGVGTSFIPDIKRGQTPSVAKVQMLANYLGVTTSELLGERLPTPAEIAAVDGAAADIARLLAEGHAPEKIAQAQDAINLLAQLDGPYYQQAKDHLEYLLARQAEDEKKKKK